MGGRTAARAADCTTVPRLVWHSTLLGRRSAGAIVAQHIIHNVTRTCHAPLPALRRCRCCSAGCIKEVTVGGSHSCLPVCCSLTALHCATGDEQATVYCTVEEAVRCMSRWQRRRQERRRQLAATARCTRVKTWGGLAPHLSQARLARFPQPRSVRRRTPTHASLESACARQLQAASRLSASKVEETADRTRSMTAAAPVAACGRCQQRRGLVLLLLSMHAVLAMDKPQRLSLLDGVQSACFALSLPSHRQKPRRSLQQQENRQEDYGHACRMAGSLNGTKPCCCGGCCRCCCCGGGGGSGGGWSCAMGCGGGAAAPCS